MKSFLAVFLVSLAAAIFGQTPIIVQPANAPAAAAAQPAPALKRDDVDVPGAIKALQEMKAANEEMLNKQQATLQALEELQQQAAQLRIYTKRS